MRNCHITNNNGVLKALVVIETARIANYETPDEVETMDDTHTCYKYYGPNALDFIMNTYGDTIPYHVQRHMNMFTSFLPFKYTLVNDVGIPPHKTRPSDSGFDLNLVSINKTVGKVTLYGTGVSVQPPAGYYFDLVPKSSIINSGYIMANGVGIIDQGYTGEILVPLLKIDPCAPDLELPCRMVQIVPRRWYGLHPVEQDDAPIMSTSRGQDVN